MPVESVGPGSPVEECNQVASTSRRSGVRSESRDRGSGSESKKDCGSNTDDAGSGSDQKTSIKELLPIRVAFGSKRKRDDPPSDPESDKKFRIDTTENLKSAMECPVCLDFPREAPIYACRNGHLVCSKCQPKIQICPVCRCEDVKCRNLLAEKFGLPLLENTSLPCVNHLYGCPHKDLGKMLGSHQPNCLHEQVSCPANHRGACKWQGPLIQVVSHASKNKCIQLLRVNEAIPFRSSIGDFSEPNTTVYTRTGVTHWKPVLLLSQNTVRYFLYLIIYRTGKGQWYLYVRSLAHENHYNKIQVEIELSPATVVSKGDNEPIVVSPKKKVSYSYKGGVASYSAKDEEILESGNYLSLDDRQVKILQQENTLFEYSVVVKKVDEHVEENIHPKETESPLPKNEMPKKIKVEVDDSSTD